MYTCPVCDFILSVCFFFNDTATTEIYTLSLHDALPIYAHTAERRKVVLVVEDEKAIGQLIADAISDEPAMRDRKSTRLNSSHEWISYAVFCLKKKKKKTTRHAKDNDKLPRRTLVRTLSP